ncbi:MAG: hypothetical protein UY23_C0003G0046 [Candidatus Jorgensenbacteria bacterium GW2011_GWA1_48_11]|uniref:Uncharacterized protein n=1 Tax=Candidatus Jorgensenbacteria bacterium GW2011_GWA1_48_11 TaxID=1618660 RepID=A0A0G1WLK1_9BACT|nr:MAG: hypothetical protein UY23_C0003G0046 [Candidatus Jorgensenbacteria bacterium GW2011_GWA1_48_11]KKW11886.1 MAG: hypothetical protein UY51_C0005G0127 [Candidatus Jorgensenbacteria bacterium GW2011_GWB1_49_9]
MSRSLKKIIYGIFYLAVIAFAGFVFYSSVFKPAPTCSDKVQNQGEAGIDCGGPCSSCVLQRLAPLRVLSVNFFGTAAGQTVILADALNPNTDYGAKDSYQFLIYNKSNQVIETLVGDAVFRPGEEIRIFSADATADFKNIGQVGLIFKNTVWQSTGVPKPDLGLGSDLKTTLVGPSIRVTGTTINRSPWSIDVLKVIAVLANKYGIQIFASQTVVSDLEGGGEAKFSVIFPSDPDLNSVFDPKATQIFFNAE